MRPTYIITPRGRQNKQSSVPFTLLANSRLVRESLLAPALAGILSRDRGRMGISAQRLLPENTLRSR